MVRSPTPRIGFTEGSFYTSANNEKIKACQVLGASDISQSDTNHHTISIAHQLLPALKPQTRTQLPETMISSTPPSVRLQLRLVTAVEVDQMRHPAVLPVASATATAAATTTTVPHPSSVPATTLLHTTPPPGR